MIRLILILTTIGLMVYLAFWFKNQKRIYEIGQMTPEELLDAPEPRKSHAERKAKQRDERGHSRPPLSKCH